MEKRILVTGFGPFGEEMRNPSLEAVMALPDRAGDALILKEELPVLFGGGGDRLLALIEKLRPDAVLGTGLAAGRRAVTPEVIAVNLKNDRIPDNQGIQPLWEKIREGGPDGIFSRMDVRKAVFSLQKAGIPAELSFSAGTFVCNEVM
jgi:pyroglutamyl-peptidase